MSDAWSLLLGDIRILERPLRISTSLTPQYNPQTNRLTIPIFTAQDLKEKVSFERMR